MHTGFYETHSVTYLPYTFCSLLNLRDFSLNRYSHKVFFYVCMYVCMYDVMYVCMYVSPIRQAASQLLDLLTIQIATVTLTSLGICNIAGTVYVCMHVCKYF